MLHLVRTNSPYTVIILAIVLLLLKLQAIAAPVLPVADTHHVLYGLVIDLLGGVFGRSAQAFTMLAVAMTFGQAIYLMSIASRRQLFQKHTYVPAFTYIMLSCLHPDLGQFSVVLLANWLILAALDAALSFNQRDESRKAIFNTGFFLGAAALLHFPAVVFAALLVLALLWLRSFKLAEWLTGLLGYMVPGYFAVGILYLFDKIKLIRDWPLLSNNLPQKGIPQLYLLGMLIGCALLLIFGVGVLMRSFYRMPVAIRRGWGAVGTLTAVALVVSACSPRTLTGSWFFVVPPMALLAVPPMLGDKRSRFATFTFYFLMALVIFCQLALRR